MKEVDGILLVYHEPLEAHAATVREHVEAFFRHSRLPVCMVNTELGYPRALDELSFRVIVFHYSLFGQPYYLGPSFRSFITRDSRTLRVAFFQDEMPWCQRRFAFIRDARIDWIYTLLDPRHWPDVYERYTPGVRLFHTIPGYVSDSLLELRRFGRAADEREIDVGYRGRQLAAHLGRGAQEKHTIGVRFEALARDSGLRLDIDSREERRIYGDAWHRFLGNCRATLGVEAGTSIFDIEDEVRLALEAWQSGPQATPFEVEHAQLIQRYEDRIFYRTVSPRHFEAAALGTAQVLFPGAYSGVVDVARHAIVLEKDFSNIEQVIAALQDRAQLASVVAAARRDLIESGRFTYARFIERFDEALLAYGFRPARGAADMLQARSLLDADLPRRRLLAEARARSFRALAAPFPGRELVRRAAQPLRPLWRKILARKW